MRAHPSGPKLGVFGGAYHHAVVGLAADDAPDALRGLPHRVEGQVVVLLYLECLRQVLQPRSVRNPQTLNLSLQVCTLHKGILANGECLL